MSQTDSTTTPGEPLWPAIRALVAWLDAANGRSEQETALRLLKLTEEVGEASQAYINLQGQNPRKLDQPGTRGQVADELVDVVVTALTALSSFTDDPQALVTDKLRRILARLDLQPLP
ncbi:MazG-like family protein [Streptacidiphilus sp. N1-3]|uniref:MazG-like family protein n=1 Tax=Streptacidiphilus alkalitolerans TaxID=3342712 RepID=A0ABV6XCN4_9ACTN